ncbi:glycoside hydrolase family 12 protein [Dendrothele bispora CBS 962.96]|uniref:Glycoside hydrolase family 12 protein n=1 Tax=Dendrothele bispora (strain CBS 962.96) TaxID=1314807 RepID=A0A4V4HCY6_DENBC|nr:glycoside hydrolase family 12 protein [Dendrothele bispora CBS 962.96]
MFARLSAFVALLLVLPFISAAPTADSAVEKRQSIDTSNHCGQWDQVTAGSYTLFLDQWGMSSASSGSDCAQLTSLSGNTIAWRNTWTWNGGSGVKSYTNVQLNAGVNKQLSAIRSIPATWQWSQSTSGNIVANVAFDLFTANSAGGSAANEIMIWLANLNAGPISSVYQSNGQPQPTVSGVSLAGHTWNLYEGSNGANKVFSFLPSTAGTQITNFSGDIKTFLNFLTSNRGLSSSQYLTTLQAGSEATSGSATLTVTGFNVAIQ